MAWNETDLKKKIKKDLPPDTWNFSPVQMGMGKSGIPDILCCVPMIIKQADVGKTFGMFVGIEAKVRGNTPTPKQQLQLDEIAVASGVALVITGEKGKPYMIERIR